MTICLRTCPVLATLLLLCAPACSDDNSPHALGIITLGEVHDGQKGTSGPAATASFVPDSRAVNACTRQIAGCMMARGPMCTPACAADEVCGFDESCQARCSKPCTLACPMDQECYFPSASAPACRARQKFDAGSLTFSGTAFGITLYPPYNFAGMTSGAPFLERASLTVQATGAANGGFERFEEQFKATTFMQSGGALAALTREKIFGGAPVPLSWTPGEDRVIVTAQGAGGVATCEADDRAGQLALQAVVLNEVQGGKPLSPITLSLTRQRTEVRKGKRVRGAALDSGWLELSTTSTETATFTNCTAAMMCGGECVDFQTSNAHCGGCDRACPADQVCGGGTCGYCDLMCGGQCADSQTSNSHCGTCGHGCTTGENCSQGSCVACTMADRGRCGACDTCINNSINSGGNGGACRDLQMNCGPGCSELSMCIRSCSTVECRHNCAAMYPAAVANYTKTIDCLCQPCQRVCAASLYCTARPL